MATKTVVKKKVLIIEDDQTIRVMIRLFLIRMKVEVYEAKDGVEGLTQAQLLKPDLIMTDLMMPILNGIDLIEALKGGIDDTLKKIPIIALTGGGRELQDKALQAGANSILQKPVRHEELRQVVSLFLKEK
jgi:CheY-like chemotaxis protein